MDENKKETIGQRINAARLEKRMSQGELGKLVGVTRGAISQWENDVPTGGLKQSHLAKLSMALGRSQEWLLSGKEVAAAHPKISTVESTYLARVTMTELAVLTYYRSANEMGQKSILASIKGIAEQSPSDSKNYNFRRKDDAM